MGNPKDRVITELGDSLLSLKVCLGRHTRTDKINEL